MDTAPAHAAIRFGLGRTPGADPGAPAAWLLNQLSTPDPAPPGVATGITAADAIATLVEDREMRRQNPNQQTSGQPAQSGHARDLFRDDTRALLDWAVDTPAPFRERLVWFWANHFTVSTRKGMVAPLIGPYLREAIRPNVTGRFADMLLAVMRHPAMLLYLDNAQSAGPRSLAASRRTAGLNENLARECLELHTIGAGAPYTQADVTEFARTLTGWSIERRENPLGFRFRPNLHEPGEKLLMGRRIPEGEAGGVAALQWLANHPATHRHLATALVRHFVADTPPPDAVRRIEGTLRDTGGHLGAAAAELVRLPSAWQPLQKLRSPADYVVAALRAAALPPDRRPDLVNLLASLGQRPFNAPLPNGWPDTATDWAGPEAMMRRIDWAYGFANRPGLPEPMQLAEAALGPLLPPTALTELRRAGSRRDAITLLLASPAFQRR